MDGADYADTLRHELRMWSITRPRSLQSGVGVSDTGTCREQARLKILGVSKTDSPSEYAAVVGHAIHMVVEEARAMFHPEMIIRRRVEVRLPEARLVLLGNPDEIDPTEPAVNDVKTVEDAAALELVQRMGATPQQRFQRHLYYAGAVQDGILNPHTRGTVRNIWLARAADTETVLVDQEPYDPVVFHAADSWWSDVTYAVDHNEEAPKDPHWSWCRSYCPWFTRCRGGDAPAERITDSYLTGVAYEHVDAKKDRRSGEQRETAARRALEVLKPTSGDMVAYQAGTVRIRWTWVNRDDLTKHGYWRLETEEVD